MTDRPKRPAYQWYPGDFRRDLAVQACSFEARALWREMLDLMHDGEPYGHLTAGGVPLDTSQLARLIGIPHRKAVAWLHELEDRRVFSRTDVGAIYSRRMIRDDEARRARATPRRISGDRRYSATGRQLRKPIPRHVLHEVRMRCGGVCVRCRTVEQLQFDHITPWARGGSDDPSNLQLLCGPCNRRKGMRLEAGRP